MHDKLALGLTAMMALTLASPMLWADAQDISKINGSIRVESGRQVGSVIEI